MATMAMETEKKKNFDLLPPEITADILSRVAADSVFNCKLVCKTWRSHINHLSFLDDHTRHVFLNDSSSMGFFVSTYFNHRTGEYKLHLGEYNENDEGIMPFKLSEPITRHPYPLEPLYNFDAGLNITSEFDSMDIISCNGLIFTGSTLNPFDMLYIYNPFTSEYVDLLPSFVNSGIFSEIYEECFIANGFGYDDSTNEYKIVRICSSHEKTLGHASVYTLGSGKWRNLGEIPHRLLNRNAGVFANGAIYWLERHGKYLMNKRIVSFDLGDEEFRIVPSPNRVSSPLPQTRHDELGVLRGRLCVIRPQYVNGRHASDIWVMKNKECSSWTWKFNVPWKYGLIQKALVGITKSGKILLHSYDGGCLFCYDPKIESLSGIENAPNLERLHMIPYTKSFVSLKGLGEEDAKCMDMPTSNNSYE